LADLKKKKLEISLYLKKRRKTNEMTEIVVALKLEINLEIIRLVNKAFFFGEGSFKGLFWGPNSPINRLVLAK